jgi:hypothetical protein
MHLHINVKSPNNISKWQMGFNSAFKVLTECRPIVFGRVGGGIGRTMLRGEGNVTEDVGRMKIQNCSRLALDIQARKRIVEQAKAHKEF